MRGPTQGPSAGQGSGSGPSVVQAVLPHLLRVCESLCFRGEPGPPPPVSITTDSPSEVVPGILAQLTVAMESGCRPTPPLLGRHLVARHCLLGHLGSQRACLGLCEGAQWMLEPGRFVLRGGEVRAAPQLALRWGLGCPAPAPISQGAPQWTPTGARQGLCCHFMEWDK